VTPRSTQGSGTRSGSTPPPPTQPASDNQNSIGDSNGDGGGGGGTSNTERTVCTFRKPAATSSGSQAGVTAGAIAGITVGGVLFTILVGICCCYKYTRNDDAEPATNSTETTKDAVLSPTSSDTPQVASSGQPEYYRASAALDSGRAASTIQETSMIIAGPQRSSSEAEILDQPHPANAGNRALPAYPSLVLSNASAMTGTSLADGEILNSTAPPPPAESRDGNAFDNVAVATYQFATASSNVQTAKPRHLPKLDLNQMSSVIINPALSAKTPSPAFGIEGNALGTPKQIAGKQTAKHFFASPSGGSSGGGSDGGGTAWDCEFCKFTSGSFDAVVDHEKSCSSNPEVVAAAKGPPRQESGPLRQTSDV